MYIFFFTTDYPYSMDSLIFCMRSLTSGDSSAIKFIENSLYKAINESNSSTALKSKQLIIINEIKYT